LKVSNVFYSYGRGPDKKNVLNDVSASFEQGKLYAVIGKSGSGKSTLFTLMAGLDLPQSGQILFEGTPTDKLDLDMYRRECVAQVFQDFCLFPLLTVLENIMYPMELCRVDKAKAKRDAIELAKLVSLPESLFDRYPGRISGGEQQRVAIARALAMDRRLIIATHDLSVMESADVIYKISDGKLHLY
jgi:putative ABC transport system ATP-binding protein